MNVRHIALVALASLALGAGAQAQVIAQQTPPPAISIPVSGATLAPAATATPAAAPNGKRARKPAPSPEPSASDTPTPPQFQTLDGVWEVALQPLSRDGRTIYSHLYVTQKADQITGTWVRNNQKNEPKATFSGTFDGRLYQITLNDGAHSYTMAGYEENFADMVGLFKTDKPGDVGIAFTAAHRKKEKL